MHNPTLEQTFSYTAHKTPNILPKKGPCLALKRERNLSSERKALFKKPVFYSIHRKTVWKTYFPISFTIVSMLYNHFSCRSVSVGRCLDVTGGMFVTRTIRLRKVAMIAVSNHRYEEGEKNGVKSLEIDQKVGRAVSWARSHCFGSASPAKSGPTITGLSLRWGGCRAV